MTSNSTSDADDQDLLNLAHSLIDPPEGMYIDSRTGTITWKPNEDQLGWHTTNVGVNDGIETTTTTFEIQVIRGEENSFPTFLVAIIIVLVGLGILLALAFLLIRKRETTEDTMEEEEGVGDSDLKTGPRVSISVAEAHAHDKEIQKLSYEELYGKRALEEEKEGMTARELKDFIHDKVDELERSKK